MDFRSTTCTDPFARHVLRCLEGAPPGSITTISPDGITVVARVDGQKVGVVSNGYESGPGSKQEVFMQSLVGDMRECGPRTLATKLQDDGSYVVSI